MHRQGCACQSQPTSSRGFSLQCICFVQEEEEEEFYRLLHDKNGHVVAPETLLVQQLNRRVHSSLPYSSSILSNLQVLRRLHE